MGVKVILENGGMLKFVFDCLKNQNISNKAVDNYVYAIKFVPDCYKTKENL